MHSFHQCSRPLPLNSKLIFGDTGRDLSSTSLSHTCCNRRATRASKQWLQLRWLLQRNDECYRHRWSKSTAREFGTSSSSRSTSRLSLTPLPLSDIFEQPNNSPMPRLLRQLRLSVLRPGIRPRVLRCRLPEHFLEQTERLKMRLFLCREWHRGLWWQSRPFAL